MNFTPVRELANTLKALPGKYHIVPDDNFGRALNEAVQGITRWNPPDFSRGIEFPEERTWWVPANEADFAEALTSSLEQQITILFQLRRSISEIEVICYNPPWEENSWRDRVFVGVRMR
jgi:hypothetical protein